jgi:hypothetical protein
MVNKIFLLLYNFSKENVSIMQQLSHKTFRGKSRNDKALLVLQQNARVQCGTRHKHCTALQSQAS